MRRRCQIPLAPWRRPVVDGPPPSLVPDPLKETVVDTESARFGDAPRVHLLAAHTIPKALLPFKYGDSMTTFRETPLVHEIVILGHHRLRA